MAKDPEAAFFKRLEGLQPCEISELKAGTHIFAVYGLDSIILFFLVTAIHNLHRMVKTCLGLNLSFCVQEITSLNLQHTQLRLFVPRLMRIQQVS